MVSWYSDGHEGSGRRLPQSRSHRQHLTGLSFLALCSQNKPLPVCSFSASGSCSPRLQKKTEEELKAGSIALSCVQRALSGTGLAQGSQGKKDEQTQKLDLSLDQDQAGKVGVAAVI